MRIKYPPLKIHVWGGLGSQLFAIALAFRLTDRFPKRKRVIVLHSSGVTRRSPEVVDLFPEFEYIVVDDFSRRSSHDSRIRRKSPKRWIIRFGKLLALHLGLWAEENDGKSKRVRLWTLSVRGHYLHRPVSEVFIRELVSRLEANANSSHIFLELEAAVHYRLGDLLELSNKKPINSFRINQVLRGLENIKVINVLSDSPEKAVSLLEDSSKNFSLCVLNLNTLETLIIASKCKLFVGTSSKISYWITLIRSTMSYGNSTYMPNEDADLLNLISPNSNSVKFYSV